MAEEVKKKIILVSTIMFSLIFIVILIFVYQELVKVYAKVDKTNGNITTKYDEYISSINNEIVTGASIVESLKRYKNQKDKINISYNFSKGGYYETIYSNHNWDIAINNFNSNMAKYTELLTKKYLVNFEQVSATGKYLLTFTCQ